MPYIDLYRIEQLVPLARHSSLPELQDLVSLFKPHNIYPNTIYPELQGHDYLLLSQYFADTLAPGGKERLARDARAHQRMVSTDNATAARMASRLEEEQSQEVRDEIQSKFARISDRLPQDFIVSNFDHLDDPLDLDLLVTVDEDTEMQVEPDESQASQELPELLHTAKKFRQSSVAKAGRLRRRTPSPTPVTKDRKMAATSPVIPSSSNDGIAVSTTHSRANHTDETEAMSAGGSDVDPSWLAGQVFCFDKYLKAPVDEIEAFQEKICRSGGATVAYSDCKASMITALSASTVLVSDQRSSQVYSSVSNWAPLSLYCAMAHYSLRLSRSRR